MKKRPTYFRILQTEKNQVPYTRMLINSLYKCGLFLNFGCFCSLSAC